MASAEGTSEPHPQIAAGDHTAYMKYALSFAKKAPRKTTNFCVGALLVDPSTNKILATGYSLEEPGNTHAEQSCFIKYAREHGLKEEELGKVLPADGAVLYTTMEPCNKRSVGNLTCVERILRYGKKGIKTVYSGIIEPETFVGVNKGRQRLEDAGVQVELVVGLEKEILEVSTAGHHPVSEEVPDK